MSDRSLSFCLVLSNFQTFEVLITGIQLRPLAGNSLKLWPVHQSTSLLATFLIFLRHCCADLGLISWGALTADSATAAGSTLYGGDGTFYGELS